MSIINLCGVFKSYRRVDDTDCVVLRDCSLRIELPEIVALVGPNGAGKSTVLHLIAHLTNPDKGVVSVTTDQDGGIQIGYVWQNYRASLLPWLSVTDNIAFGLKLKGMGRAERRIVAHKLLTQFAPRIKPSQKCYELSGGQQQIVSILRSFACLPDVLLLDEPTSALDASARWGIVHHLEEIWAKHPLPVVYVCHDIDEAVLVADRIVLLSRRTGQLAGIIQNHSERPRSPRMLASSEHLRCRREVLDFLLAEGDFESGDATSTPD